MTELAKTFEPGPIEARWYAHWEGQGLFRPERPDAEPFTIVMPPPNVTGSLHIGHALDDTLQDILVRHARREPLGAEAEQLDPLVQRGVRLAGYVPEGRPVASPRP